MEVVWPLLGDKRRRKNGEGRRGESGRHCRHCQQVTEEEEVELGSNRGGRSRRGGRRKNGKGDAKGNLSPMLNLLNFRPLEVGHAKVEISPFFINLCHDS